MSKFTYKEQHAVIVKCSSEAEQKKVFEKLKKEGFKDLNGKCRKWKSMRRMIKSIEIKKREWFTHVFLLLMYSPYFPIQSARFSKHIIKPLYRGFCLALLRYRPRAGIGVDKPFPEREKV